MPENVVRLIHNRVRILVHKKHTMIEIQKIFHGERGVDGGIGQKCVRKIGLFA